MKLINRYKLIFFFLLLITITGIVVFGYFKVSTPQTAVIQTGTIRNTVAATGSIEAESHANLSFNKVGRISYLPFKENQAVKKGQVVASLDRSDFEAVRNKELKDYLDARWDWEQQRDDYNIEGDYQKTPNLSDNQKRTYEKKQFALDRAVIDVEIADRDFKNASLIAPFDGIITQINGQINEWTSAFSSEPLVSIVDFSTIYFATEVDQEFIAKIEVGQKALVKLDAYPDKEFEAEVTEKDKATTATDDGDKVVKVKLKIPDIPSDIGLGYEGDAQIILDQKQALLVPNVAVIRRLGKTFVKVPSSPFGPEEKEVNLGIFDGLNWEVITGLEEGEKVLW